LSPHAGLQTPKPQGLRPTTFSPPRSPLRSAQAGPHWWQVAIEIPFSSPQYSTTILYPSRGGELARIGPEEVRKRYGVDPKQVPDFIALRGDPSEKLPGAPGVGPKHAAGLPPRYGTLDGVLDAGLFQAQAGTLRLYRLIATMDAKAPLPALADREPTGARSIELCAQLGAETIERPFGGEGVNFWPGMSRRVDSRNSTTGRQWQECAKSRLPHHIRRVEGWRGSTRGGLLATVKGSKQTPCFA
jgi:hypothetical protein